MVVYLPHKHIELKRYSPCNKTAYFGVSALIKAILAGKILIRNSLIQYIYLMSIFIARYTNI